MKGGKASKNRRNKRRLGKSKKMRGGYVDPSLVSDINYYNKSCSTRNNWLSNSFNSSSGKCKTLKQSSVAQIGQLNPSDLSQLYDKTNCGSTGSTVCDIIQNNMSSPVSSNPYSSQNPMYSGNTYTVGNSTYSNMGPYSLDQNSNDPNRNTNIIQNNMPSPLSSDPYSSQNPMYSGNTYTVGNSTYSNMGPYSLDQNSYDPNRNANVYNPPNSAYQGSFYGLGGKRRKGKKTKKRKY